MLWLYRRVVFGEIKNNELKKMFDLDRSEILILSFISFTNFIFWFLS